MRLTAWSAVHEQAVAQVRAGADSFANKVLGLEESVCDPFRNFTKPSKLF